MSLSKILNFFKIKKNKSKSNLKNLNEIKVALIADQFTYDSFKFEFDVIKITPYDWKEKFKTEKPDLFFCESAFDGFNFEGDYGPWHEKIFKDYRTDKENREVLFDILKYCRDNSIISIFWNKEDPVSYNNKIRSFADTAKHFDYIFTSSKECINRYKKDFNHDNVFSLMFAAQPKLFNPINTSSNRESIVSFAGSYYDDFPERAQLMNQIFDSLIEINQKFIIHDRNYYLDCRYFPKKYEKYIYPPIEYNETPNFYKKYYWGLNFNTVTDSQTMFARRVFELALSYTNILTNYSKGVEKIFGNNVFTFDKDEDLPNFNEDYQQKRLNNLYTVLESHTYKNRWKQILDTIGFDYIDEDIDVSIIFKINDIDEINDVIEKFKNIKYDYKNLIILASDNYKTVNNDEIIKKYPIINSIYNTKFELSRNITTEYWIIADLSIDEDFIGKSILHYQYLDKKISISQGEPKFNFNVENDIDKKLIHKININYLINDDSQIKVYYI